VRGSKRTLGERKGPSSDEERQAFEGGKGVPSPRKELLGSAPLVERTAEKNLDESVALTVREPCSDRGNESSQIRGLERESRQGALSARGDEDRVASWVSSCRALRESIISETTRRSGEGGSSRLRGGSGVADSVP